MLSSRKYHYKLIIRRVKIFASWIWMYKTFKHFKYLLTIKLAAFKKKKVGSICENFKKALGKDIKRIKNIKNILPIQNGEEKKYLTVMYIMKWKKI